LTNGAGSGIVSKLSAAAGWLRGFEKKLQKSVKKDLTKAGRPDKIVKLSDEGL
jgi:hypothetical protein